MVLCNYQPCMRRLWPSGVSLLDRFSWDKVLRLAPLAGDKVVGQMEDACCLSMGEEQSGLFPS